MRHVSALWLSCLAACSLVGGAGSKLGGSPSESPKSSGIAGKYEAAVEMPRNLKGAEHDLEIMKEHLTELEKQLAAGTLTNTDDLHYTRISWLTYFGAMERGGEPRCDVCKTNPNYAKLKAQAADINARFAKIEKAVAKCAYGYRMANGDLLAMTLDWSEEEWLAIVDKAMPPGYRQKERCWTDDKDGKAGKPHGWEY